MDIEKLSNDNIRGYCHFPREFGGNTDSKPDKNDETNLGFNYKKLAKKTSLEWLYPELIEIQMNQAKKENNKKRVGIHREKLSGLTGGLHSRGIDKLFRGFDMPLQRILDQANTVDRMLGQYKGLLDHSREALKHESLTKPFQSILDQANTADRLLGQHKGLLDHSREAFKHEALTKPLWADQFAKNKGIIDHLNSTNHFAKYATVLQINKPAYQAYLESTKTALSAFNIGSSHADLLSSLNRYTEYTDQALNTGMDTHTALAMLEPHRGISDSLNLRLREYEPEGKSENQEETAQDLREALEEIAELKAIISKTKKQDTKLEKRTRRNQMHILIWNVDVALRAGRVRTPTIEIWKELMHNSSDYREGEIIQSTSNYVIEWISCHGNESRLAFTSFSSAVSKARKKYNANT